MPEYPYLEIHTETIRKNAEAVCRVCREHGIDVAGVIKFSDGRPEIAKACRDGGCMEIASSRTVHLAELKRTYPEIRTMLIRIPMLCEAEEAVRYCDCSLNTELATLRALNETAGRLNKVHDVILLLDVGDLREGVMTETELLGLALEVERNMPHLHLRGIGSTFCCYGCVLPTKTNLTRLANAAEMLEKAIGRPLETVSGGSSSGMMPLMRGEVPPKINHFRIGGLIANPIGMRLNRGFTLEGMSEDTVFLHGQVIENSVKPTVPIGEGSLNWNGNLSCYEDRGNRRRAIVALGAADVGDVTKLLPLDEAVTILGGSSDHLLLDIEDCGKAYPVGSEMVFRMFYGALLHAFTARTLREEYADLLPAGV